jgi:peptidoglycan lytic transglycosylase G
MSRRRGCARFFAFACPLLLAAAGAAGWGWWQLDRPYRGFAGAETTVDVEPGLGAAAILGRLAGAGVIPNALVARAYLVYVLHDPPLVAGEYRFQGAATTRQVIAKLVRGEVVTYRVTVVEGQTLRETAAALAAAGFGAEDALLAAMGDPAPISDLDPDAADLEGYLFPETYTFAHGVRERDVVAALVRTFRERYQAKVAPLLAGGGDRAEGAAAGPPPRTLREVVTLASIVEKEARLAAERPVIAGVYANRLARGIALYADPTVIFARKRAGSWDGNLTRRDFDLDSPYNTYRRPGLPPGPICSPGLASLQAAAAPAPVPYLYFVSRNDGSHVFSTTLAEHNRNVERWQKLYWRRVWAEKRRR